MECFRQIARLVKSPFRREKQQKVLEIVGSTAYAPMMFLPMLMQCALGTPNRLSERGIARVLLR